MTEDKDFGALVFREGQQPPVGVILVRLDGMDYDARRSRVRDALDSEIEFAGHFSVIEPGQVRTRPLPGKVGEEE